MCGIYLYIKKKKSTFLTKKFKFIKHRGPDETIERSFNIKISDNLKYKIKLGFHRLAIRDITHNGMQPFEHDDMFAIINGEIYNYEKLKEMVNLYHFTSKSDCELILPLFDMFQKHMRPLCETIDGEYAMIIVDTKNKKLYMATDTLSVRPIFYYNDDDLFVAASEMKAFHNETIGSGIKRHPPGSITEYDMITEKINSHEYFDWYPEITHYEYTSVRDTLLTLLKQSVAKKLVMDRDAGFLLSGGLDSSYVAQEATIQLRKINKDARIRTFTIGMTSIDNIKDGKIIEEKNMPSDIIAARLVAKSINSIHEELWFSLETAFAIIPTIVYYAETWDQTSIRASTPMYLGIQEIKERYPNIAVIFSGEISDELLQGYLYNHKCPDAKSGREDMIRLLKNICYFDGLRADRMTSSSSCELRLPFYGDEIITHVLKSNPEFFMPEYSKKIVGKSIEKYILRDAIQNDPECLLPKEIIWREKMAFSDASGPSQEEYSWKHYIKIRTAKLSEDINTEEKLYKHYFNQFYKNSEHIIPYKWMPKFVGMTDADDPSATILSFYKDIVTK